MTAIINATLVMRDHLIPNGVLLMENGVITAFGESRKMTIPEGCEIIDAEGRYVGPGFVDIHCHGFPGGRCHTSAESFADYHLKHGTTGLLGSIYRTLSHTDTLAGIELIRNAMLKYKNLLGVHMEELLVLQGQSMNIGLYKVAQEPKDKRLLYYAQRLQRAA